MPNDIFAEIEKAANIHPEHIALEMFGDEGDIRYTYQQTLDLAKRLGQSLRNRGVNKGDRVAFWARLSPKWVIAYLGAMRNGVVVVPLDVEYGAEELSSILAQIECKAVFSVEEKLPLLKRAVEEIESAPVIVMLDSDRDDDGFLSVESMFQRGGGSSPSPEIAPPEIGPEDVALIFFTSGTTGKPKGVIIPHGSVVNSVQGLLKCLRVTAEDRALAVIPSHHVFASLSNILLPLVTGGGVTYLNALNSAELMRAMEKGRITSFPAVPQVFYLLHKKIFDEVKNKPLAVRIIFRILLGFSQLVRRTTGLNPGPVLFSKVHRVFGGRLRLLVSAASYFDPKIIRDFYSLGFTVQQGYALTETFGGGAFTPFEDNVIGSAGKPLPGVEIKLVDKDESGVGEIAISGPSLMQGYLNDPEATSEVLRDGWFYTGDLASQDEAGNVYIRGRRKEMIVLSSGKKVYPEEIEQHYLQIPHIKEMCVMGVTGDNDYARSERLHAVIVPDFDYLKRQRIVNSSQIIREGIEEYSASLPKYKRILSYEFRTEPLPRTASKKIQRYLVAKQLTNGQPGKSESAVSPYHYVEGDDLLQASKNSRQVLDVIRRETRLDREVHLDMNLELDLGFDSLQRIELLAQIEQLLNIRLGDEVASQTFTVRDLLKAVAQELSEGNGSAGKSAAPAPGAWKEIIASASADDLAERYVIEPTAFTRVVHFLALKLAFLLAKILFRVKVRGLEHLPQERPFLICPNHQSYMDGALVASVLPYRVIRYLFTLGFTPFFSGGFKDVIARLLRVVPIDADTNVWRAMRISAIGLKAKQNLIIFPEGSLSCDGELQVFKKGTAILAHELRIPIVPVAIYGSFNAWSKVGHGIRLAPISITFGPPLESDERETPHEEQDLEYARITRRIRDSISRLLEDAKAVTQSNNSLG
ncbi:MAG TPA: AMP-binding protein [Blastocatellia bacterium]|nr:AMP-binding protein [Blastocatellia bacterium]